MLRGWSPPLCPSVIALFDKKVAALVDVGHTEDVPSPEPLPGAAGTLLPTGPAASH